MKQKLFQSSIFYANFNIFSDVLERAKVIELNTFFEKLVFLTSVDLIPNSVYSNIDVVG